MKPTVEQVEAIILDAQVTFRTQNPVGFLDTQVLRMERSLIAQAIIDQWPEPQCIDSQLAEVTAQRDRMAEALKSIAENNNPNHRHNQRIAIATIKGEKP